MTTPPNFAVHGHLAFVDNRIYTILQGDPDVLPPVLPKAELLNPLSLYLQDIWQLGWVLDKVPFMVLVQKHPPFYGTLFSRLNYNPRTIPVKQVGDEAWALDKEVMHDWDRLERNLRALVSAMLHFSTARLPQMFQFWLYPMRYGYKWVCKSYHHARYICLCSRDAFVPLMASVSFMLLLMRSQESISPNFNWREKVLTRSGIHYQWLAAWRLLQSVTSRCQELVEYFTWRAGTTWEFCKIYAQQKTRRCTSTGGHQRHPQSHTTIFQGGFGT